jgi:hypothetical protein
MTQANSITRKMRRRIQQWSKLFSVSITERAARKVWKLGAAWRAAWVLARTVR